MRADRLMDTRRGALFSPPVSMHATRPAVTERPLAMPTPPPSCDAEEETGQMLSRLWEICGRYHLELQQRGRFFVIADGATQRLLKGFVLPQSTEWCWFYKASPLPAEEKQPPTVRFADDDDAEIYVKGFFTIE